jgi:hypothetical protein
VGGDADRGLGRPVQIVDPRGTELGEAPDRLGRQGFADAEDTPQVREFTALRGGQEGGEQRRYEIDCRHPVFGQ